jgi:Arc/MetJ family transcription regulator
MSRTRIAVDVDTADLIQVMSRFDVTDAAAAIALAIRMAASSPTTRAEVAALQEPEPVEELVSVTSLLRFASP